jgi:hypothetical protein
MGVTPCVTDQFKQDCLNGRAFSSDTIKIALYVAASSSLGPSTTAYTTSGEVTGTGYTAGGNTLSGFTVGLSSNTAYLTWSNTSWSAATITADTCMIYDSSNSNHSIAILSFSSASSTNGTFTISFPAAGASSTITLT